MDKKIVRFSVSLSIADEKLEAFEKLADAMMAHPGTHFRNHALTRHGISQSPDQRESKPVRFAQGLRCSIPAIHHWRDWVEAPMADNTDRERL